MARKLVIIKQFHIAFVLQVCEMLAFQSHFTKIFQISVNNVTISLNILVRMH